MDVEIRKCLDLRSWLEENMMLVNMDGVVLNKEEGYQ